METACAGLSVVSDGAGGTIRKDNMKKQSKPKAAKKDNAAAKPKTDKLKFKMCGYPLEFNEDADARNLLKGVIIGVLKLSEQGEAVRRTLWRIGEIREYENKGANPSAKDKPKAGKAATVAEKGAAK